MDITDPRPPEAEGREYRLLCLLQRVWTYSFTTKADYARVYADEIAEASSRGFITTLVVPSSTIFGRLWKITSVGLQYHEANAHIIAPQEVTNYAETYCAD